MIRPEADHSFFFGATGFRFVRRQDGHPLFSAGSLAAAKGRVLRSGG